MDELYTYMDQHIAPLGGVFTDTTVMNDHEYCYVVAAIDDLGQRSSPSRRPPVRCRKATHWHRTGWCSSMTVRLQLPALT